jgi:hypothetical protein
MKFTRHNLINALIVAAAVIAFGGFLALALPGEDKKDDSLDALGSTTTTERHVTTSTGVTTSTSLGLTTTSLQTATTARTTATTKKPSTTGTTKKPSSSSTTVATGPSGPANEHSDNSASFTHDSSGSFGVGATDPPGGSDPFRFVIKTAAGSGGVSGETASVKFIVTLTNNTSRSVAFPGGLKVVVTMRTPGGSDVVFTMTASDVTNITAGETITITQERGVSGYGTFDVTATCDVDYG